MKIENFNEIGDVNSNVLYIYIDRENISISFSCTRNPSPHIQVRALIHPRSLGEEKPGLNPRPLNRNARDAQRPR